VFFVKQHAASKKEGVEFELPDSGQLVLHKDGSIVRIFTCTVVTVGDRSNGGYAARSVVWMLVRGLQSV
jgi:hypothetical protein